MLSFLMFVGCAPKLIIKSSTFIGDENKLERSFEYNIKTKKITLINGNNISDNRFNFKSIDNKLFLKKFRSLGVKKNFCWISDELYPSYTHQYDIIFSNDNNKPKCSNQHVNGSIYDLFYSLKEEIDKNKISSLHKFQ